MKILYIAVHSHVGWGAEYWLARAFKRAGNQLLPYDFRRMRKRFPELDKQKTFLTRKISRFNPDIVFIQRGDNMPSALFDEITVPIVFWSTEPINRNHDADLLLKSDIFAHVYVHTYSCLERVKKEFSHLCSKCTVIHYGGPRNLILRNMNNKRPLFAVFNRSLSDRRLQWIEPSRDYISVFSNRFGRTYFRDLTKAKVAVNIHFADESVDDFETGIFEAMARGCAVVTEKINPAVLRDLALENALIQVENPEQLRKALADLKDNPEKLYEYRKRSVEAVGKNTWDDRAQDFLQKFKKILGDSEMTR